MSWFVSSDQQSTVTLRALWVAISALTSQKKTSSKLPVEIKVLFCAYEDWFWEFLQGAGVKI